MVNDQLTQAQGTFRHVLMSVGQTQMLFQMSNISKNILNFSNQVEGVLEKVEEVMGKIEHITETVDAITVKVEGISEHMDTLTELVQNNVNAPTNTPGNGQVGSDQPDTIGTIWVCTTALRGEITTQANRFINKPSLESYTALQTPGRVWLAHSFYNSIKSGVRQQAAVSHLLPQQINGVTSIVSARSYSTEVKNVCKHVREKLHLALLAGVYDPKNPVVHGAVPPLKALVHKIAVKFGQVADHVPIDTVWDSTTEPDCVRIAYLRREALRIFQIGRGSS